MGPTSHLLKTHDGLCTWWSLHIECPTFCACQFKSEPSLYVLLKTHHLRNKRSKLSLLLPLVNFCFVLSWKKWPSKDNISVLISRICKYNLIYRKVFADAISLRLLWQEDYPGLSEWEESHHKCPYERKGEGDLRLIEEKDAVWTWR